MNTAALANDELDDQTSSFTDGEFLELGSVSKDTHGALWGDWFDGGIILAWI